MNARIVIATLAIGLGLAAGTACSSSVSGHGTATGTQSVTTSQSSTPSTPATTQPTTTSTVVVTGGGGGGGSSSHPTTTSSSPKSSSSTPPPMPEIVTYSGTADCSGATGTATLTWTSKFATDAWIVSTFNGEGFDPKSVSGSQEVSPNGSVTLPFDCTQPFGYYVLGVYNSTGHQFEDTQVAN